MTYRNDKADLELVRERSSSRRHERRFFDRVDSVIRVQVRIALRTWPKQMMGMLGEEDLVQEIRVHLFTVVDEWNPERGSLDQYVNVFSKSRITECVRKEARRRDLLKSISSSPAPQTAAGPEDEVIAIDLARRLRRCLEFKLATAMGKRMLTLLYDLRLGSEELTLAGVTSSQVDQWRFKIRKLARECLAQFDAEERSRAKNDGDEVVDRPGRVGPRS